MKLSYLIILVLVQSAFSSASIPSSMERVRDLTLQGLSFAYNLDFVSANNKFDEAISVEPLHPRPHVGKASLLFWRYLISKNDADYELFIAFAEKAMEQAENFLDTYGADADVYICLGTMYGERAFAHGRAKSYLKAAWDGKKSYDYFVRALEVNPQAYDAYLGVGLYHYFVSFLPKPLQWITSIIGIEGNPDRGIQEIRLAAERGVYSKVEAQYSLSQFLPWYADDFASGEKILKQLSLHYPANSLFSFTLAVWEMRRSDLQSAKNRLAEIVQMEQSTTIGVKSLAMYKLAECHFRLGDYIGARRTYEKFLEEYRDENYIATANYRIGICYEMTNEREKALPFYRKATQAARRHGDDAYAGRKAEERLTAAVSFIDTTIIKAQNFLKAGEYEQAMALYSSLVVMTTISPSQRAEAVYGLGEAHYEKKLFTEALEYFKKVLTIDVGQREVWLHPWSHYQAGLCYLKLGDAAKAREHFEKIDEYDDYDYKNWLTFRTEREIEKLKKAG